MNHATHRWLGILVAAAIMAAVLPAPSAQAAKPPDPRLQQAAKALAEKKIDEGVKLLHALGNDPQASQVDRLGAFRKLLDVYAQKKDAEAAVATTKEMIAAFPRDDDILLQTYFTQANLLWSLKKWDQAVDACHQVVAHAGNDKEKAVVARFRAADFLRDSKNFAQLYDEAAELLRLLGGDPRAADALWQMAGAAWQTGRYEDSLAQARRILAEYPNAGIWQNRAVHGHVVECLRKLNKPGEVRAFYEEWEKKDPDRHWRQRWCYSAAECCQAEKDAAAALAAYRRVIAGQCGDNVSDLWYEAQCKIVELLAAADDLTAALQEAHVAFNAARVNTITNDVLRVADLFAKLDKNRDRADRFIAYQYYGPDGPDGKPGTDDDLKNPLSEIGYPADRERKEAFAKVFSQLGNDAAAMHHRGMMCLYAGQPESALYYFMDAFRRCDSGKLQDYAVPLIVNGLRAVRGHSVGLGDAVRYVLYGPGDEDGKQNVLQDPFKVYASLAPAAPFKVSPPAAKDVQLLEKLQATLMTSAADTVWPPGVRTKTFTALSRLNETLDAWPKHADWYRSLLLASADAGLKSAILNGAISASKGNVLHLGNVRDFLASLDSVDMAGDKVLARQVGNAGKTFRRGLVSLEQLQKPGALAPKVKPPRLPERKNAK